MLDFDFGLKYFYVWFPIPIWDEFTRKPPERGFNFVRS
jgi:hypothetical protein